MLTLLSPTELCNGSSISLAVRGAVGIACRTCSDCCRTVLVKMCVSQMAVECGAGNLVLIGQQTALFTAPLQSLHCTSTDPSGRLLCHLLSVNCTTGAASCPTRNDSCKLQPCALNCLLDIPVCVTHSVTVLASFSQ